jgi:uncharacterized membrane protein YphA (DoxX/SURF4 family)
MAEHLEAGQVARRGAAAPTLPSWVGTATLLLLCWPYLSSGIGKALGFSDAVAEVTTLELPAPAALAALTIATQLGGSALVLFGGGWLRAVGAIALAGFTALATLLAHAFWSFEPGSPERLRHAIVFGEHLGLVGAFLYVACSEHLRSGARGAA